jgi:hypothetical protein
LQDVSKWTLPKSSGGAAKADGPNAHAAAATAIVVGPVLIMIGLPVQPFCAQVSDLRRLYSWQPFPPTSTLSLPEA